MAYQILENSTDEAPVARSPGRGIGVMFLGFFGSWWMGLGLTAVYGTTLAVIGAVAAVGLTLVLAGWKRSRADARASASDVRDEQLEAHRSRVFHAVNIGQWLCIIALLVVLNVLQQVEWIVPGIMLIVGAHFFPLAKLFNYKLHYVTGAALVALASTFPFLSAGGPGSPVGPIGAGIILWLVCSAMLADKPQRG